MALTPGSPAAQNLAGIKAADPKNIGEAFSQLIIVHAENEDILSQFEGPESAGLPFVVKTDLKAGKGDTVNFNVMGSLGGSGQRGDNTLEGNEEFPDQQTYKVKVDQIRHAVGYTELITNLMATGMSLEEAYADLLGSWFGKRKQTDMLMKLRLQSVPGNTMYAGGKASLDTLVSADTMSTDFISELALMASSRGAVPGKVFKDQAGANIEQYLHLASSMLLNPLKADSNYLLAAQHAQERGKGNTMLRGGLVPWDGQQIFTWNVKDEITKGPMGAPLLPKAKLGDPITAGTTTFNIYGSGKTQSALGDYASFFFPFEWFPGYRYPFTSDTADLPGADSTVYYVVVYDPADRKFGIYSYVGSTGNNGNRITIQYRLGAATTGAAKQTLAGWTYDSSKNKEDFGTGCWIIPVNAKCVPYAEGYTLGRSAAVRAYGKIPMKRIRNLRDYEEKKGMGVKSIYGQGAALEADGEPHNYIRFVAAVQHQGIYLPTVT